MAICENGGAEAYRRLVAVIPEALQGGQPVRVLEAEGNLGFAGGVNRSPAMAPGAGAWWVLNPDTAPEPEAMAALVAELQSGRCDAAGCTLVLPGRRVQSYGGRWRPWLARAESIGHGSDAAAGIDAPRVLQTQNYLNGASMMVSRRFLDLVGPMREEYFLYCEEIEWCLRAQARGARLGFASEARVLHKQGTTTGAGGDRKSQGRTAVYLGTRNQMLLTRDCFPERLLVAAPAALALAAVRYGRYGAWRQLGYAISGWAAGLRNMRGAPDWI